MNGEAQWVHFSETSPSDQIRLLTDVTPTSVRLDQLEGKSWRHIEMVTERKHLFSPWTLELLQSDAMFMTKKQRLEEQPPAR